MFKLIKIDWQLAKTSASIYTKKKYTDGLKIISPFFNSVKTPAFYYKIYPSVYINFVIIKSYKHYYNEYIHL